MVLSAAWTRRFSARMRSGVGAPDPVPSRDFGDIGLSVRRRAFSYNPPPAASSVGEVAGDRGAVLWLERLRMRDGYAEAGPEWFEGARDGLHGASGQGRVFRAAAGRS